MRHIIISALFLLIALSASSQSNRIYWWQMKWAPTGSIFIPASNPDNGRVDLYHIDSLPIVSQSALSDSLTTIRNEFGAIDLEDVLSNGNTAPGQIILTSVDGNTTIGNGYYQSNFSDYEIALSGEENRIAIGNTAQGSSTQIFDPYGSGGTFLRTQNESGNLLNLIGTYNANIDIVFPAASGSLALTSDISWGQIQGDQSDIDLNGFSNADNFLKEGSNVSDLNNDMGYLTANQTITLSGDVTGSGKTAITTTIANNAVTNAKFRQSSGLSVVGRSANSTGNVADITAGTDGFVLRQLGNTLGFGLVPLSSVSATNNQIIFGSGGVQTQSANLTFNGSAFALTGTSTITSNTINGINFTGTQTATVSGSYGIRYNPTITAPALVGNNVTSVIYSTALIAAANNNQLIAMRISPTFIEGAFTGVSKIPLYIDESSNTGSSIRIQNSNSSAQCGITLHSSNNSTRAFFTYEESAGHAFISLQGLNQNRLNFSTQPLSLQSGFSTIGEFSLTGQLRLGTSATSASAKLEVQSTTQGFLPPRMTATQGSAIASPAEGLLIYVTNTNGTFTSKGWWGWSGAAWEKLNN